jgi:hypothetical protein
VEKWSIWATLREALQQTAERITDWSSLGLAPGNPLLDTRHIELLHRSRRDFVTDQIAVAQPRARVRVVTQFKMQRDDGMVLTSSQVLTNCPADQQEFIRGKRSSDSIAEADTVSLGVSNRCKRSQDLKKGRVEVWILPGDSPAVERAQALEVVALIGGALDAMLQECACKSLSQVRPLCRWMNA